MDIHVLHKQGLSIRAIARQLGLSRNTVKKWLRQPDKIPIYPERAQRASILEPFKDYLCERIQAARPHWIPATVLLREIEQQGYTGSISTVKNFIRPFKQVKEEPIKRFETEPGVQLQVDFTTIKRGKQSLKAFVATLGYSRASYVLFTQTEQQKDWLAGIEGALDYFGGVPKEILFDNAKCVMLQRNAYGDGLHQWNPALLEHAKKYGYRLRACRPYRAKTKGKVERFNRYLKQSFVTPLATTLKQNGLSLTIEVANAYIGNWLATIAHQRKHGTTKEKPQVLLEKERLTLLPLPKLTSQRFARLPQSKSPVPIESLQHPLVRYDQLLEVSL